VRILSSGLLLVFVFGLVCLGGLSGCDSRPADGTVVQDSGAVSEEQQSKVDSRYKDRKKIAKQRQPTAKRR
jgi:hypothetical protein